MKLKAFKKILEKYDENLTVLTEGYESGVTELTFKNIREIKFTKNVNSESYYGEHEEDDYGKAKGLLLERRKNE